VNAAENIRAPAIDVVVESALWDAQADATVRRAIEEAATALGADFRNHTLAVLLTDDAAVRRLNAQWRGIDKPTNVLSFPPAEMPGDATVKSLGDIAIAHETTAREAETEDKPFAHHLSHLAAHGFLHLMASFTRMPAPPRRWSSLSASSWRASACPTLTRPRAQQPGSDIHARHRRAKS